MLKFLLDEKLSIHRHAKWSDIKEYQENKRFFFIDVVSPNEEDIKSLRSIFGFHSTNLEDCTFFSESPKLEEHKNYMFTVVHNIVFNEEKMAYESHDVHIFLGENFIISVHDKDLGIIHETLQRITNGVEMEDFSCDYIYYTILDNIVDSYFPILNYWSEQIDYTEEYIYSTASGNNAINRVISIRKGLLILKRALMPQKEIMYKVSHMNISLVSEEVRVYLRDVFDHISKSSDTLEEQRDMLSNLMDAHFSKTSAGLNEVMKRLTVLSTIFLPLTFIVGIYGMNFKFMPELGWKYGYLFVMLLMAFCVVGLVIYFKKKKWF